MIGKALRDAGYNVEVKNDHPPEHGDEEIIKNAKERNRIIGQWRIKIVMDHEPWGG